MTDGTTASSTRADGQRRRVLGLSIEIFGRQGFRATSMNEIAAAAGLSKPTLYHYFRSKEELLVRIYSDVLDESLTSARRTVAAAANPLEAIRSLIASRVAYTCRNQVLLKVCFEEEHELPGHLAHEVLRRRSAFEDLFTDALEAHLAQHPEVVLASSPKVWVNTCLGAANWSYKWYSPDGPASPEQLGDQMAAALIAGIAPRP